MKYSDKKDGFVYLPVLLLVLGLCVLVISIGALVSADRRLIRSYEKRKVIYQEAEKICEKILSSFNDYLAKQETDSLNSEELHLILTEFSDFSINIEAVSDKLNTSLLKKEILTDKGISAYLYRNQDMKGQYGYLNISLTEPSVLEEIIKSHGVNEYSRLFPLLNNLPALNVHNIDEELICSVLEYCKVENSSSKAHEIYTKAQSFQGITDEQLKEIIKARSTSEVWDFLGVKTQMFEVSFTYKGLSANLIIGAVPFKKDRIREVESYIILEGKIS